MSNVAYHACPMRHLKLFLIATAIVASAPSSAQTVTVPNAPRLVEQTVAKYKIAIKLPKTWQSVQISRNEILARSGKVDGIESTCMIRLTTVAELKKSTPQDFVDAMSKEKFLAMTSISGPKPEIHIFDTALLGGIVARRIVHTQSFNGVPLTYISHQALRGPDVFTVSCYAHQSEFAGVMGTFGMIIGTTRFLP